MPCNFINKIVESLKSYIIFLNKELVASLFLKELNPQLHCYDGNSIHTYTVSLSLYSVLSLSLSLSLISEHLMNYTFLRVIIKWRSLNCKLAGVFRKQARLSTVERERVHMVVRLTKISNTLSRYFHIAWEALFWGLRHFISGNPVVFLWGQIKHCW